MRGRECPCGVRPSPVRRVELSPQNSKLLTCTFDISSQPGQLSYSADVFHNSPTTQIDTSSQVHLLVGICSSIARWLTPTGLHLHLCGAVDEKLPSIT